MGARGQNLIFSSNTLHLNFLRQCPPPNLRFTDLASQSQGSMCLCFCSACTTMPDVFMWIWGFEWGPHAYTASMLQNELSCQLPIFPLVIFLPLFCRKTLKETASPNNQRTNQIHLIFFLLVSSSCCFSVRSHCFLIIM